MLVDLLGLVARLSARRGNLLPITISADQACLNPAIECFAQHFVRDLMRRFAIRHRVAGLREDALRPFDFGAGEFVRRHGLAPWGLSAATAAVSVAYLTRVLTT